MTNKFTIKFDQDDYVTVSDKEWEIIKERNYFGENRIYKVISNEYVYIWTTIEDYIGPVYFNAPIIILHLGMQFYLNKTFFGDYTDYETFEEWQASLQDDEKEAQLEREVEEFKAKRKKELGILAS